MPVEIRKLIARSPVGWVRAWLRVLGPPFIALTAVVALLGGSIAYRLTAAFDLKAWLLCAIGLVCIHFGTSCLNDYFDFLSGTDNANQTPTPFSGGSRVIQEGYLSPSSLLFTGSSSIGIGLTTGLYFSFLYGPVILFFAVSGIFLAVGYVHPKINLSKRGLGELAVGLGFGPLMLSGVYFLQTRQLDSKIALIGTVMGLLAASVLWINEIPDYQADKTCGKTNWVVRIGKKKASFVFAVLLFLVYLLTAVFIYKNILPRGAWLVFATLPLAVRSVRIALKNYNDVETLLPANALSIALTISFGLLLTLSFLIA